MAGFFGRNLVVGIAEIGARLPLLLTAGILARSVGPEVFGGWAVILVYQALAAAVAGLGFDSSLSRLGPVAPPRLARGYLSLAARTCMLPLAAVAAVTLAFSGAIAAALGIDAATRPVLEASVLLASITTAEGLLASYFKAREAAARYVAFVGIRTIAELVAVAVVFLLLPAQAPVAQLLQYVLLLAGLKCAGYLAVVFVRPVTPERVPDGPRREFLRYGLPMIPAVLLSWFMLQGDRLLLAHLVEPAALGIYAFGAALAAYLVYVGYAVYPLLLARASRLHEAGDTPGLHRLFAAHQRVMLAAYVAALGITLPFAREGIAFLAGGEFEAAAPVFVALALAVCADRVFGVYQYVFHLVKRPGWILRLALVNAAMMAAAIGYAATAYGIRGVPWALLLATLLFNVLRFLVTRRYLPQPWPILPALGLAAIVAFGVLAVPVIWAWPAPARAALACAACAASMLIVNAVLDGGLVIAFRNLIARAGARSR